MCPGLYREAVTQNTPGLRPWVAHIKASALKVAPEACVRNSAYQTKEPREYRPAEMQSTFDHPTRIGRHFQGVSRGAINPGLKPWLFSSAISWLQTDPKKSTTPLLHHPIP